jgi:cytochrome c oxidase assembly factor CtaG
MMLAEPGIKAIVFGLVSTAVLLSQPVDGAADSNLTVHMFQHLGVFTASAFFGYGLEKQMTSRLYSLRRFSPLVIRVYQRVTRLNVRTKGLAFALVVPAVVFAYWHYPANFDLAATDETVHLLEHLSYIFSGSLVGLSVVAVPRRLKIILLYLAFMQAGMMGSMMLVWPAGFYTAYSPIDNTQMNAALMLFGAAGVTVTSAFVLRTLDVI